MVSSAARYLGVEVEFLQRNGEGDLIDFVHSFRDRVQGAVVNSDAVVKQVRARRGRLPQLTAAFRADGGAFLDDAGINSRRFFLGGAPNGGWFGYVPLTRNLPGHNIDYWIYGLQILGIASLAAAVNWTLLQSLRGREAPPDSVARLRGDPEPERHEVERRAGEHHAPRVGHETRSVGRAEPINAAADEALLGAGFDARQCIELGHLDAATGAIHGAGHSPVGGSSAPVGDVRGASLPPRAFRE